MVDEKKDEKAPEPIIEEEPVAGEIDFVPPHQWAEQERILVERYKIQGYEYEPRPYPFEVPVAAEEE